MTGTTNEGGPGARGAAGAPQRVLLTGAANPAGSAIRTALEREGHQVRATEAVDLTDPELVAPLVEGIDAIVHLAPRVLVDTLPGTPPGELLDIAARGTHVLYKAALAAGVTLAVQASTLGVMDAYPDEYEVTEQWRPRPRPEAAHLAPYLAELVAREFTRDVALERHLTAICLRLSGFAHLPFEAAAEAVVKALVTLRANRLQARGHRFQVLHVAPLTPEARYTSALAQQTIGYGVANGADR
jgi:hypothetical protein